MQTKPLTPAQLTHDVAPAVLAALQGGGFDTATPLWYYVLQEGSVHGAGNHLGTVGSRIVAETLYALVRPDRASYVNNEGDPAVTPNGIDVGGTVIGSIGELLKFSGAPI